MKILYPSLLIALLMVGCAEDPMAPYAEPTGKLAKEVFYDAAETREQGSIIYKYDPEGTLLRKEYTGYVDGFFPNVSTYQRAYEEFTYNSEGQLSERVKYSMNAQDQYEMALRAEYSYDATGQLQSSKEEGEGTILYYFDDQGRNTRIEYFINSANHLTRYVELDYNQEGQLRQERNYLRVDADNFMLSYQYEPEYSQEGRLIRKVAVEGVNEESGGFTPGIAEEYEYNLSSGLLTETKFYNPWLDYTLTSVTKFEYY